MARIFISYRREDSEGYAGRLAADLERLYGPDQVFLDVDDIGPGIDFLAEIQRALGGAEVLIALIGPRWLEPADAPRILDTSDPVRQELEIGLASDMTLLPVLVGGAAMPRADQLPASLRRLARINALRLDHSAWAEGVARLHQSLPADSGPGHVRRWAGMPSAAGGRPKAPLAIAAAVVALAAALLGGLRVADDGDGAPGGGTIALSMSTPEVITRGQFYERTDQDPGTLTPEFLAEPGISAEVRIVARGYRDRRFPERWVLRDTATADQVATSDPDDRLPNSVNFDTDPDDEDDLVFLTLPRAGGRLILRYEILEDFEGRDVLRAVESNPFAWAGRR